MGFRVGREGVGWSLGDQVRRHRERKKEQLVVEREERRRKISVAKGRT